MKKIYILFLIFVILFTASCEKTSEEYSSSVSYDDIPVEINSKSSDTLKIGCSKFTGEFDPFYASYSEDKDVVNVTSVSLVTLDKEGNIIYNATEDEGSYVNGKEYVFSGIADISVKWSTDGNEIVSITLKDSIRFSDGHLLNIDDVIFSMYVLSDPAYNGPYLFNTLPLVGLKEYIDGDASFISGIEKIDQFSLKLRLNSTDSELFSKLSIIVAPLHYYGSEELYDYEESKFGFEKGKLEFLSDKSSVPLGAGPYKFISYNDGIVKFIRNEYYFNGIPKVKFLEYIEISENTKIEKILTKDIHIVRADPTSDLFKRIKDINAGDADSRITVLDLEKNGYGYIGISAENVSVCNCNDSYESKNLRKAFATLFSVYKYHGVNKFFGRDYTIEYPINKGSWAYPDDAGSAFSVDCKGEYIYSEDMGINERYDSALAAAKEFLIAAGYTFDAGLGEFSKAPDGAKLEYDIIVLNSDDYNHPAYGILLDVKYALSRLGITLNIVDYVDPEEFWTVVYGSDCMMWVAGVEYPTQEPILRQNYYSSDNKFGLCDNALDRIIEEYPSISNVHIKESKLKECFLILRDWAVEIPLYESADVLLINSSVIDNSTINSDLFKYGFTDFLHVIELQ